MAVSSCLFHAQLVSLHGLGTVAMALFRFVTLFVLWLWREIVCGSGSLPSVFSALPCYVPNLQSRSPTVCFDDLLGASPPVGLPRLRMVSSSSGLPTIAFGILLMVLRGLVVIVFNECLSALGR